MDVRQSRRPDEGLRGPVKERQTLPEYLKQLRASRHYRQNFVAARLNVSRQTYSHYETGRIRPPARALYRLAGLYGVPVEKLLSCMMPLQGGEESCGEIYGACPESETFSGHGEGWVDEARMEGRLLHSFRSLNEEDKDEVLEEVLSIIKSKIKSKGEINSENAESEATV